MTLLPTNKTLQPKETRKFPSFKQKNKEQLLHFHFVPAGVCKTQALCLASELYMPPSAATPGGCCHLLRTVFLQTLSAKCILLCTAFWIQDLIM